MTEVISMQKVKVIGSKVKVTEGKKITDFDPNLVFPDCKSILNLWMAMKWSTKLEVA